MDMGLKLNNLSSDNTEYASFDKQTIGLGKPWRATPQELQWFRDAKFGLFIHWGAISIAGGDISWCRDAKRPFDINDELLPSDDGAGKLLVPVDEYDNLYREFNPVKFDAEQWVQIAQDAGMKYLVFTAKHHDGFSNFHTQYSDYNIANTPFKRDIVRELADACHNGGLRFGIYYSQRDWYHKDYLQGDNSKYNKFMHDQLRELLTNYGNVDILWFDSFGESDLEKDWDIEGILTMARSLQPGILINNRLSILADYNDGPEKFWGDFDTPEQRIGNYQLDRPWESCLTLVGDQWSWMPGGKMFTFEECVRSLVLSACGGGNLLLNVGPMPNGEIEDRQVMRLKEIGNWLAENGDSIYATSAGPVMPLNWGGSTRRDDTVYIHVLNYNGASIELGQFPQIHSHRVLTGGNALVRQRADSTEIKLDNLGLNRSDIIIKLSIGH
ncbi:MAG: alpha-L-fucosidase [Sedimentisphaeraceae bacterium JB056]